MRALAIALTACLLTLAAVTHLGCGSAQAGVGASAILIQDTPAGVRCYAIISGGVAVGGNCLPAN